MRKNLNRLATLALSGMMVMSMAMPAFAADFKLEKRVHTDGSTLAPATQFEFSVKPTENPTEWTYKGMDKGVEKEVTVTPKKGLAGGITVSPAVFAPQAKNFGVTTGPDAPYFKSDATISINKKVFEDNKAENGFYAYDLEEVDGGYEGVYYTKSKFRVYVLITKDDDGNYLEPTCSVVRVQTASGASDNTKVTKIDNNYGKHIPPNDTPDIPPVTPPGGETPYDTTHQVTIKKKVAGTASSKSDPFKFTITVKPGKNKTEVGTELYNVEKVGNTELGSLEALTANVPAEITVRDGDGIKITGLTKGDVVTVTEGENSYTMSVESDGSFIKTVEALKDNSVKFNAIKDNAEFTVKNTKAVVTPTGIVMNVAPYAMMLAVAGGLGVVFMNRKKEEE